MIVKVWMATCPNPYCPRADIRMIFKTKAEMKRLGLTKCRVCALPYDLSRLELDTEKKDDEHLLNLIGIEADKDAH